MHKQHDSYQNNSYKRNSERRDFLYSTVVFYVCVLRLLTKLFITNSLKEHLVVPKLWIAFKHSYGTYHSSKGPLTDVIVVVQYWTQSARGSLEVVGQVKC